MRNTDSWIGKKSDPSPPPLAGWPFFNARVTLIARPTFLHLNTSARPAWVTLVLPPQSRGENHSMRECCCHLLLGGNNFVLILGTRFYLSLGGGGGLEGGSLDFWENKRGDGWKTLEGFRGGTTQICSENEDMVGGGGTRQSSKVLGGITSVKLHSKGGSAKFPSPGDEK